MVVVFLGIVLAAIRDNLFTTMGVSCRIMILIPQIVESMYNYTSLADTAAEDGKASTV
jgi:hypothetical protein